MATGNTTTGSLSNSQQLIIDSARLVREYEGVFGKTCDMQRLSEGTGLSWEEISLAKLTAQAITETTELDDPQQIGDSLFTITPTIIGIQLVVTDRVYQRMPKSVIAKMGSLAQNAIDRKKDQDYLTVFAGATTTLSGTGTTLASGIISAAASRIMGNTTEGATGKVCTVLHSFQIKDIQDEILAGVGTYPVEGGLSQDTFRNGFEGRIVGTELYRDDNITINSTPDARGAVHAQMGIVCVQGHSPRTEQRRRPQTGGGADEMFIYDEYAYGERSTGNWLYGVLSDATSPSS